MSTTPVPVSELTLLRVAPADLAIRDQAREDATPDDQLVESVRTHGLIQPPVVEHDTDGQLVIVTGHRRVGAAIASGLSEITVIVRPHSDASVTLEQQIVENERRKQLTAGELAAGFQTLTLFGLRPEDIAAATGEKPDRVRAGLRIQSSKAAQDLVSSEVTIDLEQAAVIADFDDHPKLQAKLIETATTRPENFARDVEHIGKQRQVAVRVAELEAELDAAGVELVEVREYETSWWTGAGGGAGPGRTLTRLDIDPADHVGCPGHAAIIHNASPHYVSDLGILYVCTDWKENGHGEVSTVREKTPDELEREAEWRRQDEERQAQRELIAANTRARRAWLHGHLTTGRLRPTAHHFEILADSAFAEAAFQDGIPFHVVRHLLTGEEHDRDTWNNLTNEETILDHLENRHTPALRIALAIAIARVEETLDSAAAHRYWPALAALGYTLTDTDKQHQASTIEALAEMRAERAGENDDDSDADVDDTDEGEDGE